MEGQLVCLPGAKDSASEQVEEENNG